MNGMNLSLGQFSDHYLVLRLAQDLVKIALEKNIWWFLLHGLQQDESER